MAFISYSKAPDGRPWGFNGYAVKEDMVFDLHVSGAEQALPKEQLAAIMKSLTVEATSEIADTMEWDKRLRSAENEDEYMAALSSFLQKYPQSPWGYWQLAEHRFASKDLAKAKDAYLRALKSHKTQPFLNPLLLWQCYDGLGMCYGMMQEYDQSKKYLDLGHELAEELDDAALLAASAYNLACWHAEKGDAGKSAEFLREAVRLAPERADAARKDSSFSRIRETREFRDAITPPSPPERYPFQASHTRLGPLCKASRPPRGFMRMPLRAAMPRSHNAARARSRYSAARRGSSPSGNEGDGERVLACEREAAAEFVFKGSASLSVQEPSRIELDDE